MQPFVSAADAENKSEVQAQVYNFFSLNILFQNCITTTQFLI